MTWWQNLLVIPIWVVVGIGVAAPGVLLTPSTWGIWFFIGMWAGPLAAGWWIGYCESGDAWWPCHEVAQ